jgi:hypothetical protein
LLFRVLPPSMLYQVSFKFGSSRKSQILPDYGSSAWLGGGHQ